jgi:hypothetical protein
MKLTHYLIGGLVLAVLLAVGVFVFPRLFKEVTTDVPLPATGEAAYNPLYGLKLALQKKHHPVSAWANLAAAEGALARDDTLLLFDRPEAMTQKQAARLLDWVRGGGHLLMPGPPEGEDPGPLARALGLKAFEGPPRRRNLKSSAEADADEAFGACIALAMQGQPTAERVRTWLCNPPFVANVPGYLLAGGDAGQGWRFGRRELGRGLVTVSELDYLDNDGLREPEARAMAWQLLAPRLAAGRVHLVYSADVPSLLHLLLTKAWTVLLPLALALAAWLFWRGQRFGPLLPVPEPRRRALMEHVQAAGEFAWARGRASAMHAAVLRLFRRRLQLREPALAALPDEAQAQALATQLSLPVARVLQALRPQGLQHPATFTQSIATLLSMRSRL